MVFIFLILLYLYLFTHFRPEVDLATACWNYHLFGIPVDETAGVVVVHCEVGQQVQRTVDIHLAGYVSWTCTQMGKEGV